MKFAFCLFKYYPFGGLERNFLRILKEILSRGNSITIFTMEWEGEIPLFIKENDCNIVNIQSSGLSNHSKCASYVSNLQQHLKTEQFDLVVGFNRMPGLDLYYCADVCFIADVRRRRSPLYKLTPRYKLFSKFEKSVFSKESKTEILILSHIQKEIYQSEYHTAESRFHPVPAGIEKNNIRDLVTKNQREQFREKFNVKPDEKMLLMIGSDFVRKGVKRSLTSVASLPEKIKNNVKLFIIGKGKIKKMATFAKELNIENNIIFTGGVNNVPEYLSASDLLLHPAISENTGNAIVEALIAGVPVLTTSNCGYAIHVERANAGKVIEGIDFSQNEINKELYNLLTISKDEQTALKNNALKYSDETDFYSRPTTISDIIEKLGK